MRRLLLLLSLLFISYFGFGQGSVILTWNPSTDNVGVAGYCVWVDGERYDSTANTEYEYNLPAGEYMMTVSAYDAAGNESEQSSGLLVIISDITMPEIPDLISIEYLDASARVTWVESTDNVGVAGYYIYVNGELVDSTTSNDYVLYNMLPDEDYNLSISSFDAAGNESLKTAEFNIQLPENKLSMLVYPNPVRHGNFTVRLENGKIKPNTAVLIITTDGKIVYQVPVYEGAIMPHEVQFNLELQNGIYVVVVVVDGKRALYSYITVMNPLMYNTEYKTPINQYKYFTIEENSENINGLNNKVNILKW